MDYSKWRKILVILMVINLCFVLFSKLTKSFGAVSDYTSNLISLQEEPSSVIMNGNNYSYTLKLPSWIYSYDNILITMNGNRPNSSSYPAGYFVMSNDKIYIDSNGGIGVENGGTYCFTSISYWINTDYSNTSQSNFTTYTYNLNTEKSIRWNNYIGSGSDGSIALKGILYDYNTDEIVADSEPFNPPHFDNPDSELQSLDFDYIFVGLGDYTLQDKLYLKVLEVTNIIEDNQNSLNNIYYYNDLSFDLTNNKNFKQEFLDTGTYFYSVPYSALKLKKDKSYYFVLTSLNTSISQSQGELKESDTIFDICLCDTANLITTEEEILNSITNNTPSDNTNNNINDNLPRPGYNNSEENINIPGMNVSIPNDVTNDGFNYIFNMIYSTINPSNNADSAQDIVLNIPFVNYELRINKDLTRNLLGQDSIIITMVSTFYYFVISYFILQDIRKTIEKIKSGDIMSHTDSNIKADML